MAALAPGLGRAFDACCVGRLRAVDTLLLGRVSYDGFRSFWPPIADDPNATPEQREIARLDNTLEIVVVSDSLTSEQTEPCHNTRIMCRPGANAQIAEFKRGTGREILMFGSRTLWSDLLVHGLVDELHLMIGPFVLGAGTPIFASPLAAPLRLKDMRTWDGTGNVLIRYGTARAGRTVASSFLRLAARQPG